MSPRPAAPGDRSPRSARPFRSARALLALALLAALAACSTKPASSDTGGAGELRLGYFANVTHATAVVGVGQGTFAKELGATKLKTQIFNAGPAAVQALFA